MDKVIRLALSIRHLTKVFYSHVEILSEPPRDVPYSDAKLMWSVAASKRDGNQVRTKAIFLKPGHWDIIEVPDSSFQGKDPELYDEALTTIGKPYDIWGAILCVTPFARFHEDKEWCSGLIADILEWENAESYDPHMVVEKFLALGATLRKG